MIRKTIIGAIAAVATAGAALAGASYSFKAIEGGDLTLDAYRGGPVLVVNTASLCGFTYQYAGLQELYDEYRDRGLTVVAVPSDDFNQELASNEEVKEFCSVNYALDLPMTEVTDVRGADAHPFFAWLRDEHGYEPRWNFNKVLLDGEGNFVEAWGSGVKPTSRAITGEVERLLPKG